MNQQVDPSPAVMTDAPAIAPLTVPMTGSVKTTDQSGELVNGNTQYGSKEAVYLRGGNLPAGNYYVRVIAPGNGSKVVELGRSSGATLVVGADGEFNGFALFAETQFADTPNNGGEYQVQVSSQADFASEFTKFDNFKLRRATAPPTDGDTTTTAPPTDGDTTTTAPPTDGDTTTTAPPTDGTTPPDTTPPTDNETATLAPPVDSATTTTAPPNTETAIDPPTATGGETPTATAQVIEPGATPESSTPSGEAAANGGLPVTGSAPWAMAGIAAILMAAGVTFNRISRRNKSAAS